MPPSVAVRTRPVVAMSDAVIDVPGRRLFESVSFALVGGEVVALVGPSGSGKTTFLNVIAGIRRPTSAAQLLVADLDLLSSGVASIADHRLRHIGMVMQSAELIEELDVLDNVALPLLMQGERRRSARSRAEELLDRLGLAPLATADVTSLSGGEAQRVAVCRALVHGPRLVLADEPTGSLDPHNAAAVTAMLIDAARELDAAVLLTTHDLAVAARCDRLIAAVDAALKDSAP